MIYPDGHLDIKHPALLTVQESSKTMLSRRPVAVVQRTSQEKILNPNYTI